MTSPTPDVAATVAECLRPNGILPVDVETVGRLMDVVRSQAKALSEAEAERDRWHRVAMKAGVIICVDGSLMYGMTDRALAAEARLAEFKAEAMKIMEPFAALVEAIECTTLHAYYDDETWPLDNGANIVKIGHLRAARSFLNAQEPS